MAEENLLTRENFEQVIDDLRKMIDAKQSESQGAEVPSGVILIRDAACPAGWTRIAAWDNHFLEGNNGYGGPNGAATHNHDGSSFTLTASGNHRHTFDLPAALTGTADIINYEKGPSSRYAHENHNHYVNPPAGNTGYEGADHGIAVHPFAGATANASEHQPPYVDVLFCKKD